MTVASNFDVDSDSAMKTSSRPNDHATIAALLQSLAEASCDKKLTGIAIGVIVDGQELSAFSGWADAETRRPVAVSTVFEVGSLSKLFTSLLLAVAVKQRQVRLDDPVRDALGSAVTMPTDGKSHITYRVLANHRSSLPRLPADLLGTADPTNPYAHYDQKMLYACLTKMQTLKPIGSQEEYSNLGVGLLGHVLGKLAGSDYRQALKDRVLVPLRMFETSSEACAEQIPQLATAYQKKHKPTKHWDFTEVTVAAGGVRSSLADMLKFLCANVYPESTELADELRLMREPSELPECRRRTSLSVPVGWAVLTVLVFSSLFSTVILLPQWLTNLGGIDADRVQGLDRGGFLPYFAIFTVTMGAALRWGRSTGFVALLLASLLTWQFWHEDLAWIMLLFFGVCQIHAASTLRTPRVSGAGRLAWQSSSIRKHSLLWHNGMVGGAASFLGMVEDLPLGVVVLTNTARSVDAVGMKVLSELVKRASRVAQGRATTRKTFKFHGLLPGTRLDS